MDNEECLLALLLEGGVLVRERSGGRVVKLYRWGIGDVGVGCGEVD